MKTTGFFVELLFEKRNHYFDQNVKLVFPHLSPEQIERFKAESYRNIALSSVESPPCTSFASARTVSA